jgi:hypothetical protein
VRWMSSVPARVSVEMGLVLVRACFWSCMQRSVAGIRSRPSCTVMVACAACQSKQPTAIRHRILATLLVSNFRLARSLVALK